MMEQVRFRRLAFWERLLRDALGKATDVGIGAVAIKAWEYLGMLAFVGIPELSWRQAFTVAIFLAVWPRSTTSKYDEVT